MPKYGYMISKAVELVARKLAGMDSETISHLSQVLSEEAQAISDELQGAGEPVDADILAARLDGVVARMKYEARNQGPDPSPHEFPIFNVSHNPSAPYPNPINHLYDKRYKEAYSTFIKQNPPPKAEPEKPPAPPQALPTPTAPAVTPKPKDNPVYHQGQQYQQAPPTPTAPAVTPKPKDNSVYYQGQQYQQAPPGWPYMNPYATMPRGQAAYYQQQARMNMPPIPEQSAKPDPNQGLRRSNTSDDLTYSTNSNGEKIRVRVINDNQTNGINSTMNPNNHSRRPSQRSILKSNIESDDGQQIAPTPVRQIYARPGEAIGQETIQEIFQAVNQQNSDSSGTSQAERIIIIDRRGSSTPDDQVSLSSGDRIRTFEIRAVPTPTTPTSPLSPSTPVVAPPAVPVVVPPATPTTAPSPAPIANSSVPSPYAARPTVYYPQAQVQLQYQQPNMYGSMPANLYGSRSQFPAAARSYYPMMFYRY